MAKKENVEALGRVTTEYDAAKLQAIELYVREKNADLSRAMTDTLDKLYARYVPPSVQYFLECQRGIDGLKNEEQRAGGDAKNGSSEGSL